MRKIKWLSLIFLVFLFFLSACAKKPVRSEFVKLDSSSKNKQQVIKINKPVKIFAVAPRRITPFVLRVWIAPWRDENDRLKWSRTVYVDLPINKWNLGIKPYLSNVEIQKILSVKSPQERITTKIRSFTRPHRH